MLGRMSDTNRVPPLLTPDGTGLGVRLAFTSRRGGASSAPYDTLNLSSMVGDEQDAVTENIDRVTSAAGFTAGSIALLRQVHGNTVAEADPTTCGVIGEGDALIARRPGVTVGVLTADCVPVLMAGPKGVAAVHAGWRGVIGGVVEAAVTQMGDVTAAWIGPSIHACCYEVGSEVIEAFQDRDLPVAKDHVDPARATQVLLRRLGIDRVWFSDICTSCDDDYFSYRRDGLTGRQGAFIAWQ
jgi:YfiH family protein